MSKYLYKIDPCDLLCPICRTPSYGGQQKELLCTNSSCSVFSVPVELVNGKPLLIDFNNSIVNKEFILRHQGVSMVRRSKSKLKTIILRLIGENNIYTKENVIRLETILIEKKEPNILIIGGGEVGSGLKDFYRKFSDSILAFDIYDSPNVEFIADAHNIPVRDEYFDLVIIQAVLEHVLNPAEVVFELTRVLKKGGVVYAETPFMQHVHEGAFDFTRFTESGHRYLFRNFERLDSGYTKGVGTSLIWSLDYFFSGLFRSRIIGKITRVLFFWLRFFDRIIPYAYNIDGACGVFFLGQKTISMRSDLEIIRYYQGNQR